ncbi:hypothetical protein TMatcc_002267 [Talaromyces marneffei ATCC 18224]
MEKRHKRRLASVAQAQIASLACGTIDLRSCSPRREVDWEKLDISEKVRREGTFGGDFEKPAVRKSPAVMTIELRGRVDNVHLLRVPAEGIHPEHLSSWVPCKCENGKEAWNVYDPAQKGQ